MAGKFNFDYWVGRTLQITVCEKDNFEHNT